MMKFVVEIALVWFASQRQFVVAAGMVIVQPPEVGAVPVRILNDAVPFALAMLAPEPPQPAPAIVGIVAETTVFNGDGKSLSAIAEAV